MRILLAVAQSGGAGAAAKSLKISHATVSRRIAALERSMQTNLVDRSSQTWRITPAGMRIADKAAEMESAAQDAQRYAQAFSADLSGTVRITTGPTGFRFLVLPALDAVRRRLPNIRFELVVQDQIVDLAARQADIAVRFTKKPDPNLFGQRVCRVGYRLFGTAALIERLKTQRRTQSPGELPVVPIIDMLSHGESFPGWADGHLSPSSPTDKVDSLETLLESARLGFGVANLPCVLSGHLSELVADPVMPTTYPFDLWVLAHADTHTSARIRGVKDILLSQLKSRKSDIEGPA